MVVSWISDVVTLDVLLLLVIDCCPGAWLGDTASGGGVEMCRWRRCWVLMVGTFSTVIWDVLVAAVVFG